MEITIDDICDFWANFSNIGAVFFAFNATHN